MAPIVKQVYRIGVDVGGTNTDCALLRMTEVTANGQLSTPEVIATQKKPTTSDVTAGICEAIGSVLEASQVPRADILSVNIGTTHFINAVTQSDRTKLNRVAVLRLCGPFCRELPPFDGFPNRLRDILEGHVGYLKGGFEIDGRVIAEVDEEEVIIHAKIIASSGIQAVAIVGVFSPLDSGPLTQEEHVKEILLRELPHADIVCSRDIGRVGFIERENVSILNASILEVGRNIVSSFEAALSDLNLKCPLYLTQNDGTITDAIAARKAPIKTFSSGTTNSLTGAIFLSGIHNKKGAVDLETDQVLMVDIGGTTSDFAALSSSGFPRQSNAIVDIAGVRTNFSTPEVLSIGLGGGSLVTCNVDGSVTVGPKSVGYALINESQCFGGMTLTATDIVVASEANSSIASGWKHDIPESVRLQARKNIREQIQKGVSRMRTSDSGRLILLLVGGGSIIQMDELPEVDLCIRPPFHDCANAVGAAIAKISGDIDVIVMPGSRTHQEIEDDLKSQAIALAKKNGAQPSSIKVVEMDIIPINYVNNNVVRGVARAVGELGHQPVKHVFTKRSPQEKGSARKISDSWTQITTEPRTNVMEMDLDGYVPSVSKTSGEWYISEVDLAFISEGVGIYGTGGGGPVYSIYMNALNVLRRLPAGRMRVIEPDNVPLQDQFAYVARVGSPSVFSERLEGDNEISTALDALARYGGYSHYGGIVHPEIGGGNGMCGFSAGAIMDIPIVDADSMGRAFPTVDMSLPYVYRSCDAWPAVVADARSNVQIIASADSAQRMENFLRQAAVELGHSALFAMTIPGRSVREYCCHGVMSQAWYVGRQIYLARQKNNNVLEAVVSTWPGSRLLYSGKIVSVSKHVVGGYTIGEAVLKPDAESIDVGQAQDQTCRRSLVIQYKNEYLYAALKDAEGHLETLCTTPDMISVLNQDGSALPTSELRYGLQVAVLAMPAHPLWHTPTGMKVAGPAAFK
ncbi:beta subunit of N-methylhydantoinase A/acetone carboxylase [Exophiala viscosa]|uniref:Beta subunit of N-methylhydantoinase A/acetone carboxylase n=1 Tax=Exophiala viscosa TaxID=2486360 RepID=A0AAN6DTU7_9EURO|nr:beta subunit of N-methylhydantoinase A/acetone carboxylase [Exophiala viscosa]